MRIIAGTARSRTIEAPKGRDTRPTLDRVRENLFNILQMRIFDAVCLDLFAGSGALAFEALSRGASHAVLCDHDRNAHLVEKKNAQSLGFDERCEIFLSDWHDAVQRLSGRAFDLIFLDPPYMMHDLRDVTEACEKLLAEAGRVIIEFENDQLPQISERLNILDRRRYGIVGIAICGRTVSEEENEHA